LIYKALHEHKVKPRIKQRKTEAGQEEKRNEEVRQRQSYTERGKSPHVISLLIELFSTMVVDYSLDQLTLKPASRAQEIEARKRSSVEWAKWLTLEEYLQRDEEAEVLDHAKDGRLVSW
jgi:hypothetical protein